MLERELHKQQISCDPAEPVTPRTGQTKKPGQDRGEDRGANPRDSSLSKNPLTCQVLDVGF